jgi:hypothetical protein
MSRCQWRSVTNEPFKFLKWMGGEPNNASSVLFEIASGLFNGISGDFLNYKRIFKGRRGNIGAWNDILGNVLLPGYFLGFEVPHPNSCNHR